LKIKKGEYFSLRSPSLEGGLLLLCESNPNRNFNSEFSFSNTNMRASNIDTLSNKVTTIDMFSDRFNSLVFDTLKLL